MFGVDSETLLIILVAVSVAGLVFAVLFPLLSGSSGDSVRRLKQISSGKAKGSDSVNRLKLEQMSSNNRRKQVQDALKQVERDRTSQKKNNSLQMQLAQAGLQHVTVSNFWTICGVLGAISFIAFYILLGNIFIAILGSIAAGLGLPRIWLKRSRKKYQTDFLLELPNAIDIMSRGVKSGLAIKECMIMVAEETSDPVRVEFAGLVDVQKLGLTFEQGLGRLYERTLLPEINFLKIVISLQESSGGQLSEVLTNLSIVLRDRHKMKAKINSLAQESRTSSYIIGAMPPAMVVLMYVMRPDIMGNMFSSPIGQILLVGSAIWMLIGFVVMRKMVNFDF